jgi:nicotinamide riboside transporter PnuC
VLGTADMTENHDTIRNVLDTVSVFATLGSLLNLLSPIFGLIGAILGLMRIAEMVTGKPFSVLIGRKKDDAQ